MPKRFVRISIGTTLLLSLVFTGLPGCAQSELVAGGHAPSAIGSIPPLSANVQEVNLTLSVTGHHGHFDPSLTTTDISILDNDQPPDRVTYFERQTNIPVVIALVIDVSDSITYAFKNEQRAAANFVKNDLHSRDSAIVVAFNQQPQVLQGPTGDYQLLQTAIKHMTRGGETALYDAVALAAQELGKIQDTGPSRRAIIVVSDGEDNASLMSLQAAAEAAQQSDSAVYVLKVGDYTTNEVDDAVKQLCNLTGGKVLGILDEDGIPFHKIEQDLRNQYAIAYVPANTRPDGTYHRISVRTSKKLKLHYRSGYFAR
jgi:Ca-activated chloride channel family protein